jgi:DNA-binding MarR family transcriptional regulator
MITREPVDLSADEDRMLAASIGRSWKELRRGAAMSALRDHLFGAGDEFLEPGQWDTLDLLVQAGAWRMSDLAEALRVDPSTATRAVQRLVRAGLAERSTDAADGRVVMVSATAAGHERHEAIARRRRQTMECMLSAFDAEERRTLAGLLERFVAALDHVAEELSPPRPAADGSRGSSVAPHG